MVEKMDGKGGRVKGEVDRGEGDGWGGRCKGEGDGRGGEGDEGGGR